MENTTSVIDEAKAVVLDRANSDQQIPANEISFSSSEEGKGGRKKRKGGDGEKNSRSRSRSPGGKKDGIKRSRSRERSDRAGSRDEAPVGREVDERENIEDAM